MDPSTPTPDSSRSQAHESPPVDEQPELKVYETTSGDQGTLASELYWADDATQSQYTFYREGTPTLPEEKAARPVYTRHSIAVHETEPVREKRAVIGLGRCKWVTVIIVLLFVLLAIGIGVGVGLTAHARSSGKPSAVETSAPTSGPATDGPVPSGTATSLVQSSTTSSPSPSPTSSTTFDCPASNNTFYTVPGSNKRFHRICSIDYSGEDEANDLAFVATTSMPECMNQCAIFPGCTGCAWGFIKGDKGPKYRCWMKNNLQKSHKATSEWAFAILQ